MPVTSLLLLRITPHKPRSWAGSRAARRVSTGEPRGHVNKGCVLGLTSVFPGFSTDGTCEALWFLFLSVWFLFLSVSASRCLPVVLAFWIPLVSDRLSGVTIIYYYHQTPPRPAGAVQRRAARRQAAALELC